MSFCQSFSAASPSFPIEKPRLRTKASLFLPQAAAKLSEIEVSAAIRSGLGEAIHELSTARTDSITAMHITLSSSSACSPDKFASQALALQKLVSALSHLGQKVQSMETSMDTGRIYMKYLEADPNTLCWEFVKHGSCPRGQSCRWGHAVMTNFVICISFKPNTAEYDYPRDDTEVTCRPQMVGEMAYEGEEPQPKLFFSTVPREVCKTSEEAIGDASTRAGGGQLCSFGLIDASDALFAARSRDSDEADKFDAPDASTDTDGSHQCASDKADSVDGSRGSQEQSESADECSGAGSRFFSESADEGFGANASVADDEEDFSCPQRLLSSEASLRMKNWAEYDEDEDDPEMLKKLRVPRQAEKSENGGSVAVKTSEAGNVGRRRIRHSHAKDGI